MGRSLHRHALLFVCGLYNALRTGILGPAPIILKRFARTALSEVLACGDGPDGQEKRRCQLQVLQGGALSGHDEPRQGIQLGDRRHWFNRWDFGLVLAFLRFLIPLCFLFLHVCSALRGMEKLHHLWYMHLGWNATLAGWIGHLISPGPTCVPLRGSKSSALQDPKAPVWLRPPPGLLYSGCFLFHFCMSAGTETPEGLASRKGGALGLHVLGERGEHSSLRALGCSWNGGAATSAERSFPRHHLTGRPELSQTYSVRCNESVPASKRPGILGPFSPGLNTRKQRKKEKQGSHCWKVFAAAPRSRSPFQGSSKSQDQSNWSDAHGAKKQAGPLEVAL